MANLRDTIEIRNLEMSAFGTFPRPMPPGGGRPPIGLRPPTGTGPSRGPSLRSSDAKKKGKKKNKKKNLKAGGPGSGRKPGYGSKKQNDGGTKLVDKYTKLADKHMDKASAHEESREHASTYGRDDYLNAMQNHHDAIAEHYYNAADSAAAGNLKEAAQHASRGNKLASKTAQVKEKAKKLIAKDTRRF